MSQSYDYLGLQRPASLYIGTVLPSEIHHAQLLPDRVVVFMRDKDAFAMKVLAALRHQFGGHAVKRKEGP